jgi:hypothetical protein
MRVLPPYFGDEVKDIVQVIPDVLFDDPNKHSQLLQAELYPSCARIAYGMQERWNNLLRNCLTLMFPFTGPEDRTYTWEECHRL